MRSGHLDSEEPSSPLTAEWFLKINHKQKEKETGLINILSEPKADQGAPGVGAVPVP